MRRHLYGALLVCAALAGCANLNSIYRDVDLNGDHVNAQAIALDIKQRVVVSSPRLGRQSERIGNVVCAEPSPDALSAYIASLGASGIPLPAPPTGARATDPFNVAAATGETSASVGLRTQSIQLLRDILFSNCLAYMNAGVSEEQYYALQRRSQNVTLGLLAIEQLTSAVKADQAALGTSGSAATGADNVDKETENLQAARKEHLAAQAEYDKVAKAAQDAGAKLTPQKAKVAQAQKELAAVDPKDADKRSAAQKALDAEKDVLAALEEEESQARLQLADRRRQLNNAQYFVAAAEKVLADAQRRVRASVGGNASFAGSGSGGRGGVSDQVAKSVVEIVNSVLTVNTTGEDCSAALAGVLTTNAPSDRQLEFAARCIPGDEARRRIAETLPVTETKRDAFIKRLPIQ